MEASGAMKRALALFEGVIVTLLVVLMALTVLAATIELVVVFVRGLVSSPFDLLSVNELLDVFGVFLIVLIGLELIDTVKVYFAEKRIHVALVLMVAMIAVARKVIILDLTGVPVSTLIGIAALIVALASGYYLVKRP